jgi:DNA-binding LytR/AlgR family response regulator
LEKTTNIRFKTANLLNVAFLEEVIYFKGNINYTHIHFKSGTEVRATCTLKKIEQITAFYPYFLRVHKNTLLNKNFIQVFDDIENIAFLKDGTQIQVSRRKAQICRI